MNALTLNLLAEEELAQQQRARDPLKMAIAIGVSLVTLTVGAGVWMSVRVSARDGQCYLLKAKLEKMNTGGLTDGEDAFRECQRLATGFAEINQRRMLVAPQLALIKDLVPPVIELSSLNVQMRVETRVPAPVAPDAGPPKVEHAREWLDLQLNGRATGARPELAVDDFLKLLRTSPALRAAVESVELLSISRVGDTTSAPPAAQFAIDCQYKEKG